MFLQNVKLSPEYKTLTPAELEAFFFFLWFNIWLTFRLWGGRPYILPKIWAVSELHYDLLSVVPVHADSYSAYSSTLKIDAIFLPESSCSSRNVKRQSQEGSSESLSGEAQRYWVSCLRTLLFTILLLDFLSNFLSLWLYSPLDLGRFLSFLILYTFGRTPWTGD
jgi:hypothetical protein